MEKSKVYFTKEITSESLVNIYLEFDSKNEQSHII